MLRPASNSAVVTRSALVWISIATTRGSPHALSILSRRGVASMPCPRFQIFCRSSLRFRTPLINPSRSPEQEKKSPNTFSVPYGSDDEDPTSDADSVIMMEQHICPFTIDLTETEGTASSRPEVACSPTRVIDLTAEVDVGSPVSMNGRYSPVPSSRQSFSTSPAPCVEPLPLLAGSGTAEWTDIESEDSTSQASEDAEDLPRYMDEDDQSIDSEDSVGYTSLSEETSDDSMSDSEMGSYGEDSDEDADEEESYPFEAPRTFGVPIHAVRDTTGIISLVLSGVLC